MVGETVGETVGEAFLWMTRIETACRYQLDLLSCGREVQELSEQVRSTVIQQGKEIFGTGGVESGDGYWPAMLRKLEREAGRDWMT